MPRTLRRQPAVESALTRVAAMSRKGGRTRRPAGPMAVFLAQAADACAGSIEIRGLGSRVWPLTCELIGRRILGRRSAGPRQQVLNPGGGGSARTTARRTYPSVGKAGL